MPEGLGHRVIREYFLTHPCAKPQDAARDLDVSMSTIYRHMARIRDEWRQKKRLLGELQTNQESQP